MLLRLRRWFKKSKKDVDHSKRGESDDSAMSELAESLRKEMQGLVVEIKTLKRQREGLFRDLHDIMLTKSQESTPVEVVPIFPIPSINRKRSSQSVWLPVKSTPRNDSTEKVEMGLFGPRSRAPSIIESPSSASISEGGGSNPANNDTASKEASQETHTVNHTRAMSATSQSSTSNHSLVSTPSTPTRTAWRVVEKKPTSVYLARARTSTA